MNGSRSHRMGFLLLVVLALGVPARFAAASELDDLLTLKDFSAHRISSSDPSGGNLDMRRVDAGKTLTLAEIDGPAVINHIWFTLMYPSRGALRKMVLRIWFDDIAQPCVKAPLGDFFGLGHAQIYAYASQPLAVGPHCGLNSYWRMPFAKKARLTVTNEGKQDCQALYFQIDYQTLPKSATGGLSASANTGGQAASGTKPSDDALHFFAAYRQAFPCEKGKPYWILETEGGRGHFVGCNLSVEQQDDSWWGEGDVRMYVDGEEKPSVAGTGSEDDFGGAWCYSHEFSYPLFGAPLRARFMDNDVLVHCTPDLRGKDLDPWRWPQAWKPGDLWNVYRYHVTDPVPFRKSIRVNIEHGWQNNERADWFSSVAYWYQTGTPSPRAALPSAEDRIPRYLRSLDRGGGRWEGENFVDAAQVSGGKVEEAGMDFWGDLFSGRSSLQWDATQPGQTLTLTFTIPKTDTYRVIAKPCKVEPGGTFTVALDDLPPGESVNLFQPPPFPGLFEVVVAEKQLAAGPHTLRFTAKPSDPKSKGMRLILDRIQVSPPAQRAGTQPASGQ